MDDQIFSPGQAYVALSRFPNWNNIQIATLSRSAFMTDPTVINEYNWLEKVAQNPLPI